MFFYYNKKTNQKNEVDDDNTIVPNTQKILYGLKHTWYYKQRRSSLSY